MLKRRPSTAARRKARGVTLIEVLIAMLVLMIGLLGTIGMKAAGVMYVTQANSRAVAAYHAGEIFDRLRANPVRAKAGAYDLALAAAAPATPSTIAEVDLAQWRARLGQNLPSGSGSVAVTADGLATVTIQWLERPDANTEAVTTSYTFETQL